MKTSKWHKILAFWLLGVFFLNATPREFIHLFANHEDTQDQDHADGLVFSKVHQHCGFLNIGVPPYEATRFEYIPLVVSIDWHYLSAPLQPCAEVVSSFNDLRGPPNSSI